MTEAPKILFDGSKSAPKTIALAHGAGAPMTSPFMAAMAAQLAAKGFRVARFNFPYMAEREQTGKKRPPNPQRVLLETWSAVIQALGGPEGLIVGGKSMGGRMATLIAADLETAGTPVVGIVALGYPFHPPGRPEKLRTEHLMNLKTPLLVCQGERDPFGTRDAVTGFNLPKRITFHWSADGDHSLKPRKKSGHTEAENLAAAVQAVATFVGNL